MLPLNHENNGGVKLLYEINWGNIIIHFVFLWLITLFTAYIKKTSLDPKTKYYFNIAAIVLVFLTVLHFIGYEFYIIFSLIEWATKFILPWVALYWVVRLIKVFEAKS